MKLLNFLKRKKIILFGTILLIILMISSILFYFIYFSKQNVISRVTESVVLVEVYDNNDLLLATGSGFCAYKNNTFVTNYHVIEGAYKILLKDSNSNTIEVKNIVGFSDKYDLAILETESTNLKPLEIKTAGFKIGDDVIAIGSPLGLQNTVSTGIISSINNENNDEIQISAPISHGSSGGALFNKYGQVIGITYASYDDGQNLNLAINASILEEMYNSLNNNGDMTVEKITEDNYNECIYEIDGQETSNYGHLQELQFAGCLGERDMDTLILTNPDIYTLDSDNIFYKITNNKEIFENQTNYTNFYFYTILSEKQKYEVIDYYNYLQAYDSMWCRSLSLGKGRDTSMCIQNNLEDYTIDELIINNDILTRSFLAIYDVAIKNMSSSEITSYIKSLPISNARKMSLLYLNGYTPRDFSKDQNQEFIDFIYLSSWNGLDAQNNQITNDDVIQLFGYTVKNGIIYW